MMSLGDHINGWTVDVEGYSAGLLIDQAGEYYITNSLFTNADQDGLRAANTTIVHIWDSEFHNNGDEGLDVQEGAKAGRGMSLTD